MIIRCGGVARRRRPQPSAALRRRQPPPPPLCPSHGGGAFLQPSAGAPPRAPLDGGAANSRRRPPFSENRHAQRRGKPGGRPLAGARPGCRAPFGGPVNRSQRAPGGPPTGGDRGPQQAPHRAPDGRTAGAAELAPRSRRVCGHSGPSPTFCPRVGGPSQEGLPNRRAFPGRALVLGARRAPESPRLRAFPPADASAPGRPSSGGAPNRRQQRPPAGALVAPRKARRRVRAGPPLLDQELLSCPI